MINVYTLTPIDTFGSNMYIIESEKEYAVIDPSVDFFIAARSYPEIKHGTKYIILTHAHFDHFLCIDTWKAQTDAEVLIGRYDAPALSDPYKNAYKIFYAKDCGYFGKYTPLDHGNELVLGNEHFKVIATPGHTPGGISLLFCDNIFVGDTVFADGAYGRYDLPGGDLEALIHSIKYLKALDGALTVYPGHGRSFYADEIKKYFSNF